MDNTLHNLYDVAVRELAINQANLFENYRQTGIMLENQLMLKEGVVLKYQNNRLLNENLFIQSEQVFLLEDIDKQLSDLKDFLVLKTDVEEYEIFARDLIYNIKKMDEKLEKSHDNVYVAIEANAILKIISRHEISTKSFTQIQDKEYFDKIIGNITQKANSCPQIDKKYIESFIPIYNSTVLLLTDLKKYDNYYLNNFPANLKQIGMPEPPKILEIESELMEEIKSPYKDLGIFSVKLKNYISSSDELEKIFQEFYAEKKKYEIGVIRSKYNEIEIQYINTSEKYKKEIEKIKTCVAAINSFLKNHSELKIDFPDIVFNQKNPEEINFQNLEENCNREIDFKERELQVYYDDRLCELRKKIANIENKSKMNFFTKLLGFIKK